MAKPEDVRYEEAASILNGSLVVDQGGYFKQVIPNNNSWGVTEFSATRVVAVNEDEGVVAIVYAPAAMDRLEEAVAELAALKNQDTSYLVLPIDRHDNAFVFPWGIQADGNLVVVDGKIYTHPFVDAKEVPLEEPDVELSPVSVRAAVFKPLNKKTRRFH